MCMMDGCMYILFMSDGDADDEEWRGCGQRERHFGQRRIRGNSFPNWKRNSGN